jgi:NhaP-type Na+/H+ or K+/H+ antiporter
MILSFRGKDPTTCAAALTSPPMDSAVFEIASLVALAVAATWLAARLNVPSIVVLLVTGVVMGPVLQVLDPDALAGDVLLPLVSVSVGLILFEGGLSLRFREIASSQRVLWLLVTVGVLVTWALGALSASAFLGFPSGLAVLLGAILTVSGPTVIGPILTSVRPRQSVSSLLKWESIVIDPIGAMLAVIAFEVIFVAEGGGSNVLRTAGLFVADGVVSGLVVAVPTGYALRRHLIPERLVPLVGMTAALIAFAAADVLAEESGLLATTVLGLALANRKELRTKSIIQFSEVLQTLLVGLLFIILSARLTREQLSEISIGVVGLVLVLVLVARPLVAWLATWRSEFSARERGFIASVAPRGIVAAAVASVFALELEEMGVEGAEVLPPITFAVIVGTVLIYGFGAGPLARWLGLAEKSSQGVVIVGAGQVERFVGDALAEAGVTVLFATTSRRDEVDARLVGRRTYYGNLIDHELPLDLDLSGIGRVLAMTPNDEVNTLATERFAEVFGAGETYQLAATPFGPGIEAQSEAFGGRTLFDAGLTYADLARRIDEGAEIKRTKLTSGFNVEHLREEMGPGGLTLFLLRNQQLFIRATDAPRRILDRAQPGDTVLWLTSP